MVPGYCRIIEITLNRTKIVLFLEKLYLTMQGCMYNNIKNVLGGDKRNVLESGVISADVVGPRTTYTLAVNRS